MKLFLLLKKEIQELFPAYFALVMSTGIISIAAHLLGFSLISHLLFWINSVAFILLIVLLSLRLVFFFPYFKTDLASHQKGAGFFTIVAACCIVGIQLVLLRQSFFPAIVLWFFALVIWFILIYTFFVIITVKAEKPSLEKGINGIWLVIVVATQSVSILGTLLSKQLPLPTERVIFFTLSAFLFGCMLYIILITLIFYRLTFFPVRAEEFAPPYWINMGAVAISTLAGATLILNIDEVTGFQDFIPFLKGFSLLFWATGTWWIPLIVFLGVWRHVYKKFPLFYHPQYWGMVFPLGMYTVCTWRLAQALEIPYLQLIADFFIYLAFAAWLVAFLGMGFHLLKLFTSSATRY